MFYNLPFLSSFENFTSKCSLLKAEKVVKRLLIHICTYWFSCFTKKQSVRLYLASILTNWYMIHMYISNKLRVQEIFETYFQVYRLFWRTFLFWKIYIFICLHLNFRALMRKWHWKKDEKIVRQKQCLNPQIFRKLGSMARWATICCGR